jgi:hypothetical protein
MPRARPSAVTDRIHPLLEATDLTGLTRFLERHSRLPGPRGNLELAFALADAAAQAPAASRERLWRQCLRWTALTEAAAPENTPAAFLPFCGALVVGAVAAAHPERLDEALDVLHGSACDPRWRTREGAAMGLQRLLKAQRDSTLSCLARWVAGDDWLAMRGAAAAVAEPALLVDPILAGAAVRLHEAIIKRVLSARERGERFRVLRQGLGYSLSVVTVVRPAEGFALMRRLAASGDPDGLWIVRENLKKRRLSDRLPHETAALQRFVATAPSGR